METTHSKTSRTKKPAPKIVVESWDEVWQSFGQRSTIELMNKAGWKTVTQAAESTGLSRPRINSIAHEGGFEWIKEKVYSGGKTREMVFVRPKATTCQ